VFVTSHQPHPISEASLCTRTNGTGLHRSRRLLPCGDSQLRPVVSSTASAMFAMAAATISKHFVGDLLLLG